MPPFPIANWHELQGTRGFLFLNRGHWVVPIQFACPHSAVRASVRTGDKGMGTKDFRPLLQAGPLSPILLTSGRRRVGHVIPGTPVWVKRCVPMCRFALKIGMILKAAVATAKYAKDTNGQS